MTSMKQIGLLAAGCQPWNRDVCAANGNRFAYCATLAIYIYQMDKNYNEFKLHSIMSEHKKSITAISWHPTNPDLFASAGTDSKIFVWNVAEQQCISKLERTKVISPSCIGWCTHDHEAVAYISGRGPLYMWKCDGSNQVIPHKDAQGFISNVTLFRWHHRKLGKMVFGHEDGSLSFCNTGARSVRHVLHPINLENEEDDPVIALEWDPLSTDYLIAVNEKYGTRLVDSESRTCLMTFVNPSVATSICTLAWVPSAPGMFVTGDAHVGVLRLWSVSKSSPILSIKLKNTGFHALCVLNTSSESDVTPNSILPATSTSQSSPLSGGSKTYQSYALPPGHAVCTFQDGGVGLYDFRKRRWDFLRELGHIETIFDCKFKPDNPDLLATASFDGTMKVWDVNSLTAVNSSPGNEGIIYSLSWAPADLNCIAAGTSRNGVFIWDLNKGKTIRRFNEHAKASIFSVAWNQKDSRRIASCAADSFCIVREVDGKILQKYRHPGSVFGCDWSPNNKDMLATGCEDGIVRVYYIATSSEQPLKTFRGHAAKVFHVKWSPLRDGILCSGSDDGTIRIWDYTQDSCVNILVGHTGHVRGLLWNPEIPYLLMSGSWDYTIRVWDVRDGACVDKVLDHGADVYGLTTHPQRPFVVASCSRDSTVRIWSLSSLFSTIQIRILADKPLQEVVAPTDHALAVTTVHVMSGRVSRDLKQRVECFRGNVNRQIILKWFSELFSPPSGLRNLWELVSVLNGMDDAMLSETYSKGIMHVKHLMKFKSSEAQQFEMAKVKKIGGKSREDRLREGANLQIKLGNIQRYCEIMVELEEWEKALSVAPAVSLKYWKQLSERYAKFLSSQGFSECVPHHLAIGNLKEIVDFFISHGQHDDAILVSQMACEGGPERDNKDLIKSVRNVEIPTGDRNGIELPRKEHLRLLHHASERLADRHFQEGSPVIAACCHLANGDVKKALSKLIRGNELELAICIGRSLECYRAEAQSLITMATELLARRCEKLGKWELAVDLLRTVPDNEQYLVQTCARCSGSVAEINHLHEKAGLPTVEECQKRAEALKSQNIEEAVKFYLLSSTPEVALEIGLPYVKSKIQDGNWKSDDILQLVKMMSCTRTDKIMQQSCTKVRTELITLSAYVGALEAIRRGYITVVPALYSLAKHLCSKDDVDLPFSANEINLEMEAWSAVMQHKMSKNTELPENTIVDPPTSRQLSLYESILQRAGENTSDLEQGLDMATGSHLPTHSDIHLSLFSKRRIQGPAFFLEDATSVVSYNDALMWAKVNLFSPLATGVLINPF
ncbi:WD repeat-containing protein 17 [Holothuria leucospilota]|uniref:WD repeat-containing protein 17 n=1 Tax=Holothuria leucospilota TaxID=206669 RepID=A0A9Q1BKR0_HOLLE|nr:WD repeat-containing protein 17 [Holothuria leucospilota]